MSKTKTVIVPATCKDCFRTDEKCKDCMIELFFEIPEVKSKVEEVSLRVSLTDITCPRGIKIQDVSKQCDFKWEEASVSEDEPEGDNNSADDGFTKKEISEDFDIISEAFSSLLVKKKGGDKVDRMICVGKNKKGEDLFIYSSDKLVNGV